MKNTKELLEENRQWVEQTFKKVDAKLSKVTVRSRDKLADGVVENGVHRSTPPTNWTSGFWGGLNYMMYAYTKNEDYLATARKSELLLDEALEKYEKLSHDVGFMWHLTSGASYRLFGDEKSKVRNLFAASMLFSRFVPSGGFIRVWNGEGRENWTIVDCMMNLPLLYWASDVIGDDRFKQIAVAHADMTMLDHVREDGSVVHIVEHDRQTGESVCTYGGQGYGVGSSWSRGQAWGLYGFVISYIHTGDWKYIDTAKRIANYFIANCCDDWLPRIDFRAPSEPVYYDSTAGAIAACGLIELGKILPEHEGGMYTNAALNLLKAMDKAFMNYDPDRDDMLNYGSGRYPTDPSQIGKAHLSIIYGDYYYTEALLKLLGADFFPW